MTIEFIIGQILTFVSYFIFWISRFLKKKKNILLYDNISRLFAIVAFIFLGTYDGIKNTVYVIIRNFLGQSTNNKNKKLKIIAFSLMLLILVIMYAIQFNGLSTICITFCGILNLYGVILCEEQGIRIFGMLGSFFYLMFMMFTNNYTGVGCELICFFVMLLSYIKYKNKTV